MHRPIRLLLIACCLALSVFGSPHAQNATCSEEEIGRVVDDTGRALRDLNRQSERQISAKLTVLGEKTGWTDEQRIANTQKILQDDKLAQFDRRIDVLIGRIDTLGQSSPQTDACHRLDAIKQVRDQLLTILGQKSGYVLAKLDTAIQAPDEPAKPAVALPIRKHAGNAKPKQAAKPAPAIETTTNVRSDVDDGAKWSTATTSETAHAPDDQGLPEVTGPPVSIVPERSESGYSIQEIRDAGRGVFGTVSAELAAVLNYAFQQFGHPTGYIVGGEGGGAILAGLRYGKGVLWLKNAGNRRVFWQGPSIGYDFGAAGSRTMFLVYNLKDAGLIFGRFTGIEGAAYIAGGVGITVLTNGDVVIVPIRSGVGLRLGANVGYLKFTKRQTWNPF
ncbi:MAG: DUF1134 domain-containing protein [Hyphomicrobiaceae bacterium]